jgi:hypothetical protein
VLSALGLDGSDVATLQRLSLAYMYLDNLSIVEKILTCCPDLEHLYLSYFALDLYPQCTVLERYIVQQNILLTAFLRCEDNII